MDAIILKGMTFFGHHGYFPEERKLGQKFIVDLELTLNLKPAGESDDITKSVNYAEIFQLIKENVEQTQFHLIEGLAEHISTLLLKNYSLIQEIALTITKPSVAIQGICESAGIRLNRKR